MVVLLSIFGFLVFAVVVLYLLLGTERYGADRPASQLQIGAHPGALDANLLRPEPCRTIRVYFIKPSRYDEDGYVQVFRYGVQPNNTLTVLKALNENYNRNFGAKRNVHLDTVIWDEICDGVVSPETIKAIKEKAQEDGVELLIGMAGVQSNQYPRGRDIALQFVAHGVRVDDGRIPRQWLSRIARLSPQLRHHHDCWRGRKSVGPYNRGSV